MMRSIIVCFLLFAFLAGPASAEPVSGAIAAVAGWVKGLSTVGLSLLRLAAGAAISAIQKARARKAASADAGIQTEITLAGGENSESFIIGYYATSGSWVCPPLSRGPRNNTLTYVIDLGGMAGQTLIGFYADNDKIEFDGAFDHAQTRTSVGERYAGKVRLTFFDGSQTAAPSILLDNYSDYPDFPWSADMIGRGRNWVVVEFERDQQLWPDPPETLYELNGVPVFDPRTGTVGQSDNLAVLIYNILRGFEFEDGTPWGGDADEADLPLSVWAAAMNECDRLIDLADGGTEKQFRGGFEVKVDEHEPAEVIERLLDACGGDIAEEGGVWYIHVGAPALPSMFITDGDLQKDQPSEMDPFPGLNSTVNGLTMRFPNPEMVWAVSEAERVLRTDLEAQDGGRRLLESLNLGACPFPLQGQRVGQAYVEDSRRFLTHKLFLPSDTAKLPPLATVAWYSDYNQYDGKLFQIEGKGVYPYNLITAFQVRETDPSDFAWSVTDEMPVLVSLPQQTPPELYVINDAEVVPTVVTDEGGVPRAAAIKVQELDPDLDGVEWFIRDNSDTVIARGVAMSAGDSFVITEGVLSGQDYLVGLRAVGGPLVAWSPMYPVTTDEVLIKKDALDPEVLDAAKKDSDDALDRFIRNSHTPSIRAQEGYSRESSKAALKSLKAELALRQGLKENSEEIASEAVTRAQEILNEAAAREQGDNALSASLASLSITVSDNAAAIVQEALARSNEDGTLAADIAAILVTTAQNAAAIVTEQTARADGDTANADAITALGVTVGQNTSDISAEQTARADADTALANNIASVLAITGSNTAAIGTEQTARTTQDAALAADIAALTVTVGTNTSDIVTEQTTRASEDAALAASIASLLTTVNGNTAAISTESSARVAADLVQTNNLASYISSNDTAVASANTSIDTLVAENLAQAALITALSTTQGNHTNSITTLQQITSGQENVLQVTSEINGALAGYALRSAVLAGGEVYSDFTFVADAFRILSGTSGVPPFVYYATATDVDGVTIPAGTLLLEKAMIGEAWIGQTQIANGVISTSKLAAAAITAEKIASSAITADKLAANSITTDKIQAGAVGVLQAAGLWQSPNFVAGVSGLSINWATADVELNDLVVRGDMLEPNAISTRTISTPSAGSIPGTSSTASISGHSASDFVNIGVSFTHRYAETTIQLKVGSESWQDLKTFELNANSATRYFSFMHSGTADTVQVRLSHVGSHSSKSASNFRVISQIVQE